ncbi:MAG: ATP-binding protein [Eubacterium sp.]|nr:ATP-binding protein [Eubacterium sp.]
MAKVNKRIARSILHALEGGMVPENGLPFIAVGRKEEVEVITSDMDRIAEGFSTFRLLEGAYGTGKSFMAQLIKNEALLRDFVVMDCELAPERKLCGTKKEGLETYRMLMSRLSSRTCPSGGALEEILDSYVFRLQEEAKGKGLAAPEEIREYMEAASADLKKKTEQLPHGFDFYAALGLYMDSVAHHNEELKVQVLRWFRGEYHTRTEAKRTLGLPVIVEDGNWFAYIKLLAVFVKEAGYTGLYMILDELTQITRNIVNSTTREHNFERLLSIYNDCYGNGARYMGIILCGIPSSIHDTRRGIFSYEALKSRLSTSRLQGDDLIGSPIIKLSMLTPEEFAALIERIEEMHAMLHEKGGYFTEEERITFVNCEYQRIGAASHLTPREFIRDFLTILNLKAEKRPDDSMEDFLYRGGGIEMTPSMIGKAEEEDEEIEMRYENFTV